MIFIKPIKIFVTFFVVIIIFVTFLVFKCQFKTDSKLDRNQISIDNRVRKNIKQGKYELKNIKVSKYSDMFETKRYEARTSVGQFDIYGANYFGYSKDKDNEEGFTLYYTYHNNTKNKHRLQKSLLDILSVKKMKLLSISDNDDKGKFIKNINVYHGMDYRTTYQDEMRLKNGDKNVDPGESAEGAISYRVKYKYANRKKSDHESPKVILKLKADPQSSVMLGEMNIPVDWLFD